MADPENCIECGFPLPDGRHCSFCKNDNIELKVDAMKKRMTKMQQERDAALAENTRLKDRISDLLLICEIEGRPVGVIPSSIDPSTAS